MVAAGWTSRGVRSCPLTVAPADNTLRTSREAGHPSTDARLSCCQDCYTGEGADTVSEYVFTTGKMHVEVISECRWTMKVLGTR
jgi:hypothetical protein